MSPEIFIALAVFAIGGGTLIGLGMRKRPKRTPEINRSITLK